MNISGRSADRIELDFYRSLFNYGGGGVTTFPRATFAFPETCPSAAVAAFVPRPYVLHKATAASPVPFRNTDYLELEDVSHGMSRPCVCDIKMGTHKFYRVAAKRGEGPRYSLEKCNRQEKQMAESCARELGWLIGGMLGTHGKSTKASISKLFSAEEAVDSLLTFLTGTTGTADSATVLCRARTLRSELEKVAAWFRDYGDYCMYNSSLFVAYDDAERLGPDDPSSLQVKIIDFAHSWRRGLGEVDMSGFRFGVETLVLSLRAFEEGLRALRVGQPACRAVESSVALAMEKIQRLGPPQLAGCIGAHTQRRSPELQAWLQRALHGLPSRLTRKASFSSSQVLLGRTKPLVVVYVFARKEGPKMELVGARGSEEGGSHGSQSSESVHAIVMTRKLPLLDQLDALLENRVRPDLVICKLHSAVAAQASESDRAFVAEYEELRRAAVRAAGSLELVTMDTQRLLSDRFRMASLLQEASEAVSFAFGCTGEGPPVVFVPSAANVAPPGDDSAAGASAASSLPPFPLVFKPRNSSSHDCMALVFDGPGLRCCAGRLGAQGYRLEQFENHGGVVFKVFVLGDRIKVAKRPSLPALPDELSDDSLAALAAELKGTHVRAEGGVGYVAFDSAVLTKQRGQIGACLDLADEPMLDSAVVTAINEALCHRLGMRLLGFDLLRCPVPGGGGRRCRYALVDVNLFPGYKGWEGATACLNAYLLAHATDAYVATELPTLSAPFVIRRLCARTLLASAAPACRAGPSLVDEDALEAEHEVLLLDSEELNDNALDDAHHGVHVRYVASGSNTIFAVRAAGRGGGIYRVYQRALRGLDGFGPPVKLFGIYTCRAAFHAVP